jgi:hypothetical protein
VAAIAMLSGQGTAWADHAHEHPSAGAAVARLELNAGKKWATDATLRDGMSAIRAAFDADHSTIHAGTQSTVQYDALATRIETEVNGIVQNCHLPPAADANLHYVIADLLEGVRLMRGGDAARSRHDGAALVHGALLAYPKYFDDPAFEG